MNAKETNRHIRNAKLRGKLISSDEARPAKAQHKSPCSDCPWRRDSLRGWLGSVSAAEWIQLAHSETPEPCHVHTGAHCAGLAIYRANVAKTLRDPNAFELPPNKETCFASPLEFMEHHDIFKQEEET